MMKIRSCQLIFRNSKAPEQNVTSYLSSEDHDLCTIQYTIFYGARARVPL